eukprot:scaffold21.g2099.t1
MPSVIVICGSGLAGTAAGVTAAQARPDAEVLVLEKEQGMGGNSNKASSGINALTPEQGDSLEIFKADTLKSGGGLSNERLVETLVEGSSAAISFLESAGVDLSGVVQLGGHSVKRTHHNPSGPNVGFAIMKALQGRLAQLPNVRVVKGANVTELLREGGRLSGVAYTEAASGAAEHVHADAVVLATGGFGASRALLARHAPQVAELATTNGPFAQGEGLGLAGALGADMVGLDQVQVHPTGFVDPADLAAGTKFLAPEKLRGVGAVLLNPSGRRFVDELTTRDRVSKAILGLPGRQALLVLGHAGGELFGPALGFYQAKGLVTKADSLPALAAAAGVEERTLAEEVAAYGAAAAAGRDAFGKTVFPSAMDPKGPFYLARVTPVVHYTMGGVAIDDDAHVLDAAGRPIPGLFAAGEVSGGVHGANRLGGNSLLECVVFGRRAGRSAAAFVG